MLSVAAPLSFAVLLGGVRVAAASVSEAVHPDAASLGDPQVPGDFTTYDNGWLSMRYHPSLAAKVDVLQRHANTIKSELSALLGEPVLGRVQVVIGRTPGEMETLAPRGARLPRYASGVAFSEQGLVLLTAASRYPGHRHDLLEVFRHELAHVALHDAVGRQNIPRWFNEGFAVHASKEAETARLQALWTATLADRLIPLKQLTQGFPQDADTASVAYAEAADVVRFLMRQDEAHRFESLIGRLARGQEFSAALNDAYSTDLFTLEKQWQKDVARRYTFWPVIFGGSLVWFGAFGLMIAAYYRRKRQAQKTLAVWAREEAIEDARQRLAQAVLQTAGQWNNGSWNSGAGAVRIVVATQTVGQDVAAQEGQPGEDRAATQVSLPNGHRESLRAVPTIEHEGRRHTLH